MSIDINATFSKEAIKREGIGIIDMYILNASVNGFDPLYFANWNQNIRGFQMNATGDLLATTELYTGLPIERESVKSNLSGEISEVSISIPNVDRNMESYIQSYDYLRGRNVYCLTSFVKHLPSGNSANHIGSVPDRFAIMKEKLYVDGVRSDAKVVTFSCKPKFLIKNKILPGRTFSRECSWSYASSECGITNATLLASYPKCDGTLEQCIERKNRSRQCIERKNRSRFGGFVSVPQRGLVII